MISLRDKLKILYYFFSPSSGLLVALGFLTIAYGLIEMAAVGALFPVLDACVKEITVEKADPVGFFNIDVLYLKAQAILGFNYVVTSGIVLVVITIFVFIYRTFYTYFSQNVLAYLWVHHQEEMYSVLCRAQYSFYTNQKQGKLIYNSAVASESIAAVIDSSIRGISEAIKAVFLIALLLVSSWTITSAVAIIGIAYIYFSRRVIRNMVNKSSKESLDLKQKQHQNLNEFISGIKLVKVFAKTKYWMDQYIHMARRNARLLIKIQMGSLLPSFVMQLIIGLGIGAIGIYIGTQSPEAIVRLVPLLGLFVITSNRINGAISTAISYFAAIARHFPNLVACYDFLTTTPVISQIKQLKTEFTFKNEIRLKNVSFFYNGSSNKVLSNVSFSIPKNNTVALVGASGGGKTTILNLLLRLFENQAGTILIDDVDIRSIDYETYYKILGFVSQEPFLFNGNIFDNVAFGAQASLEDVKAACQKADAHEFIEGLEHGYQTVVGESGLKLSGGQKQRIGIARALLKQPQILILDEPTSALDNQSEYRIQSTLDKLSHSLTVLIVAHRLTTIQYADKIIVLKDGGIEQQGTHESLLASNGYYCELYHQKSPALI